MLALLFLASHCFSACPCFSLLLCESSFFPCFCCFLCHRSCLVAFFLLFLVFFSCFSNSTSKQCLSPGLLVPWSLFPWSLGWSPVWSYVGLLLPPRACASKNHNVLSIVLLMFASPNLSPGPPVPWAPCFLLCLLLVSCACYSVCVSPSVSRSFDMFIVLQGASGRQANAG